jgi:5-hydroxyisourate hydrolase-like protein (transthyretin family)
MRLLYTLLLSIGIAGATVAYAQTPAGTGPTSSGYYFTAQAAEPTIYVFPSGTPTPDSKTASMFPASTAVTVSVRDTAGKPVAGVPVRFEVPQNSALQGSVSITPQSATTDQDGKAKVQMQTTSSATTGAGNVLARVDNMTNEIGISVDMAKLRSRN